MTTTLDEQVKQLAEAAGLKVRHLAGDTLWSVDGPGLQVKLSWWGHRETWRVSRQCRRWRVVYNGKSLEKAIAEAKRWAG